MKSYRSKVTRFFSDLFWFYFCFNGLITVFFLPADSFAAVFTVTNSTELQNALEAAQNNGQSDTINIASGTYSTDAVTFTYKVTSEENFALTIIGAGKETTILDGGSSKPVLALYTSDDIGLLDDSNADITIRDLTIQNGKSITGFGGGLSILTAFANITITSCNFMNNAAVIGGGVSLESSLGGTITLKNNTFDKNFASSTGNPGGGGNKGFGGGLQILASFSENISLKNNTFTNNTTDLFGGGASLNAFFGGDIILTHNKFTGNSVFSFQLNASGGGTSVEVDLGDITFTNNTFVHNIATVGLSRIRRNAFGGGASAGTDSGDITFTNNTFTRNNTISTLSGNIDFGGGFSVDVLSDSSTINIYNNIVFANGVTLGSGEEIFVKDDVNDNRIGSPVNLFNNNFESVFFNNNIEIILDFSSQCEDTTGCTPNINKMNNIGEDPLFKNAFQGNVHLNATSPAINKGTDSAPDLPAIDFEGNPRIDGPAPDIGADEFSEIVNFLVNFPQPSTFRRLNNSGCPSGFVGRLRFTSTLANITNSSDLVGDRSLSNLAIVVKELTNGNLIRIPGGGTGGVGTRITVPKPNSGDFQDGILGPAESVNVTFTICLKNENRFEFFLDVLGMVQ
jgi:hypothetical protein